MIHLCKPLTTLTTNLVRAKVTKEEDLDDNHHYDVKVAIMIMIILSYTNDCVSIVISMTTVMLMLPRYVTLVYSDSQDCSHIDGHGDRGSYCS